MLKFFKRKNKNQNNDNDISKDSIDTTAVDLNKSIDHTHNQNTSSNDVQKDVHTEVHNDNLTTKPSDEIQQRKNLADATTLRHEHVSNDTSQTTESKSTTDSNNTSTSIIDAVAKSEPEDTNKQDVAPPIDSIQQRKNVAAATTQKHNNIEQVIEDKIKQQEIKQEQKQERKLEQKLEKSRNGFGKKMKHLFSFKKSIDDDLFEDIETTLLMADVGAKATMEIVDNTAKSVKRRKLSDSQAVYDSLKSHLQDLAKTVEKPLVIDTSKKPYVILVIGVNGVGKTTTIAKIARNFKSQGKSVMLAAGDTFRAAAVEQLKTWGEREDIPVIAQTTGSDSASVIFDAMSSAKAKGVDILIADTAGRLHTQVNLMQELGKISRVMKKNDETAPHETLIVVDGCTGQNAISQIKEFNKTTKITGIAITKLDGTAKGGVLFNLAKEFGIPVRYIGVGEQSSDLKPYVAKDFVEALLG